MPSKDTDTSRTTDLSTVQEGRARRRFIRQGAAFLLATGAVAQARGVRADDCDRARTQGQQGGGDKHTIAGSDSDAGASADPAGCGRRRYDEPKISRNTTPATPAVPFTVTRLKG